MIFTTRDTIQILRLKTQKINNHISYEHRSLHKVQRAIKNTIESRKSHKYVT